MKGQVSISIDDYNELVEAKKVLVEYSKCETIALVEVYELHKQVEFKAIKESEAVELLVSENKRLNEMLERSNNGSKPNNVSDTALEIMRGGVIIYIIILVAFIGYCLS